MSDIKYDFNGTQLKASTEFLAKQIIRAHTNKIAFNESNAFCIKSNGKWETHSNKSIKKHVKSQLKCINDELDRMGALSFSTKTKISELKKILFDDRCVADIVNQLKFSTKKLSEMGLTNCIIFNNGYYSIPDDDFFEKPMVVGPNYIDNTNTVILMNYIDLYDVPTADIDELREYMTALFPVPKVRSHVIHHLCELLYTRNRDPTIIIPQKVILFDGHDGCGAKTFIKLLRHIFSTSEFILSLINRISPGMMNLNSDMKTDGICYFPFDTFFDTVNEDASGDTNAYFQRKAKIFGYSDLVRMATTLVSVLVHALQGLPIDGIFDCSMIQWDATVLKIGRNLRLLEAIMSATTDAEPIIDEFIASNILLDDLFLTYRIAIRSNKKNTLDVIKKLLHLYPDIHELNETVLIEAIIVQNLPLVSYLLNEMKCDPRTYNSFSLIVAAKCIKYDISNISYMKDLMELGADIHTRSGLIYKVAATNLNTQLIEYLMDNAVIIYPWGQFCVNAMLNKYYDFACGASKFLVNRLINTFVSSGIDLDSLEDQNAINKAMQLGLIKQTLSSKSTDQICCISTELIDPNEEYHECSNDKVRHIVSKIFYDQWNKKCPACFKAIRSHVTYVNKME
jgi:hypothetical protein